MKNLIAEASRLGVSVHMAHLDDDPTLLGYYLPHERIIVIRLGMTRAQTHAVLAHEVAHLQLGHECSTDANERQADARAARMLVDDERYLLAARVNPDPHAIADELGVTVGVVRDYQTYCLQRIGHHTYSRARIGAGQFSTRWANSPAG